MVRVPKEGKMISRFILKTNKEYKKRVQKDDGMGRFWVHLKEFRLTIESLEFSI